MPLPQGLPDERRRRRHKARNALQSVLLIGGMAILSGACGWILAGPEGIAWGVFLCGVGLAFGPNVSPRLVLRMYGAVPLPRHEIPELHELLEELARGAGLARVPELHYAPTPVPTAFTVGGAAGSAIALTDGVLRIMDLREVAGILAHEISHIVNRDLWIMGLADAISRVTASMSATALLLLVVNAPLWLAEQATFPWLFIILLFFAPTIGTLLQLALSRTREYDADLGAVALTGDPAGLASALDKLHRYEVGLFGSILLPGWRMPVPSFLRTHPATAERIERLRSLQGRRSAVEYDGIAPVRLSTFRSPADRKPRWRITGLWH